MSEHRTYRSRGRVYCMDSGTVPHPSDVRGELRRGAFTRAWCSCCEREVALRENGCLSHHGPNPERKALLAAVTSSKRAKVAPEALTREMIADLMAVADVRVATDCQALLSGRGGRAKLGLVRERVASAYNRLIVAREAAPWSR